MTSAEQTVCAAGARTIQVCCRRTHSRAATAAAHAHADLLSEANTRATNSAVRESEARRAVDAAERKLIDAEAAQRRAESDARVERERAERAEKEREAAVHETSDARAAAALASATQRRVEQRTRELEQQLDEVRATSERQLSAANARAEQADQRVRDARADAAASIAAGMKKRTTVKTFEFVWSFF